MTPENRHNALIGTANGRFAVSGQPPTRERVCPVRARATLTECEKYAII